MRTMTITLLIRLVITAAAQPDSVTPLAMRAVKTNTTP